MIKEKHFKKFKQVIVGDILEYLKDFNISVELLEIVDNEEYALYLFNDIIENHGARFINVSKIYGIENIVKHFIEIKICLEIFELKELEGIEIYGDSNYRFCFVGEGLYVVSGSCYSFSGIEGDLRDSVLKNISLKMALEKKLLNKKNFQEIMLRKSKI